MAVKEGFRRVNKLGRVIGTVGAFLILSALIVMLVVALIASRSSSFSPGLSLADFGVFALIGVYLVFLGIVILTVSWIGEGFAEKDESE